MDADQAIEQLFGLDPDRFVRERDRLVRSLKKEGRREEADQIAALRKPTLAAWAVNQVARRHRRDVDRLLDAGHHLIAAQRAVLGGGKREALDDARRAEQGAVVRLRDAAEKILGNRASATTLAQVEDTLHAAAVSESGRELLARGRFVREQSQTGWDVFEALSGDAPGKTRPERERRTREDRAQLLEEAREGLRQARTARADAARAVRDAEREHGRALQQLETAKLTLDEARQKLDRAAKELKKAERALQDAQRPKR